MSIGIWYLLFWIMDFISWFYDACYLKVTFSFASHFCAHSNSVFIEQVEKFQGREEKWSHAWVIGILREKKELRLKHEKVT